MEAALKAFFTQDPRGALAVYLFGSVARGEAHADSDVDVGALFASDPPATLAAPQFALEAVLERQLRHPVQVVTLNRASADLVHRVLRDGRLVLDRDRSARIRFGETYYRLLHLDRREPERTLFEVPAGYSVEDQPPRLPRPPLPPQP
jgi:predicted nucleotidyltransferase